MRELTLYVETGLKLISDGWGGGVQKRKSDPTKNPKISKPPATLLFGTGE